MSNNYEIKDILSAVDTLLGNKEKEIPELAAQIEKPLLLKNEAKNSKEELDNVPNDTERIILQAEKYLKK